MFGACEHLVLPFLTTVAFVSMSCSLGNCPFPATGLPTSTQ
jgi:hypothetical protein